MDGPKYLPVLYWKKTVFLADYAGNKPKKNGKNS
jgi:hypothetical protein